MEMRLDEVRRRREQVGCMGSDSTAEPIYLFLMEMCVEVQSADVNSLVHSNSEVGYSEGNQTDSSYLLALVPQNFQIEEH